MAGAGSTQLAAILQAWFDEDVRSRLLQGLGADSALLAGLTEFTRWNDAVALGFPSLLGPSLPPALSQRQTEGQDLAALGFRQAIERANTSCRDQGYFGPANAVLDFQAFAQNVFPPGVNLATERLDRTRVLNELCVRVEIVSATFPPPPYPVGQPQTLQVQARITFPGAAAQPLFTPIEIILNGQGVAEADAIGFVTQGLANIQGGFSTTVTPTGSAPVVLRVVARIGALEFPRLNDVFAEALVGGGGLVVSPSSVTLAPGQTQQFTATLNGQPHAVTWSVSGAVATITPGGLFEAFTTPVTVVVTATSTTNPALTGTATVTIGGTGTASLAVGFREANAKDGTDARVDCDDLVELDFDDMPATFPAQVGAACPRASAQLTATRTGSTVVFAGTLSLSGDPPGMDVLSVFAFARAKIQVIASGTGVTATINPAWVGQVTGDNICSVTITVGVVPILGPADQVLDLRYSSESPAQGTTSGSVPFDLDGYQAQVGIEGFCRGDSGFSAAGSGTAVTLTFTAL